MTEVSKIDDSEENDFDLDELGHEVAKDELRRMLQNAHVAEIARKKAEFKFLGIDPDNSLGDRDFLSA